MGKHRSSLKAWCRSLIPIVLFALTVNICQARGRDYKKREGLTGSLASVAPTDGTSLYLSTSELRQGRVVTRIVTTSILITIPCGAPEESSSLASDLITTQSSTHSLDATRGLGSSPIQPSTSSIVNPGVSSSVTNRNNTIGSPANSASIPGSSIQRSQSSDLESTSTNNANGGFSTSSTNPSSASQESQRGSTSFAIPNSFLQTSLSEGGTAQTSRRTTAPDETTTSTASSQPVQLSSSISHAAISDETSTSDVTKGTSVIEVPQTSASGTDRNVETSPMPASASSVASARATTTPISMTEIGQQPTKPPVVSTNDDQKSTKKGDDDDGKSTKAYPGSTQEDTASSTQHVSSTEHSATPTSTSAPGSSGTNSPSSTTTSSTSPENGDFTSYYMTATIQPPEGVDPRTWITWQSTEVTKTSTRDGQAWPTIFPAWSCIGGQLLCHPRCLIPIILCDLPALKLPGPVGFPWAKPPPRKPKGKPRKVRKDDPTDPEDPEDDESEPSETATSSSEASCTATTTFFPDCKQGCTASPIVGSDSSTSFTTSCNTATCKPSIVCSNTVDTTTTTTITTVSATPTESYCGDVGSSCLSCNNKRSDLSGRSLYEKWEPKPDPDILSGPQGLTAAENWPGGPQEWWQRVWNYVWHYCDGLDGPRDLGVITGDKLRESVGYSTMHADVWGDEPLMGATGPFWGCSGILIITKRGIYTSHVWEVPNFYPGGYGDYDIDKEFQEGVLDFLETGSGNRPGEGEFVKGDPTDGTKGSKQIPYPGIKQLKETTPIFDNIPEDTLQVLFIFPVSGGMFSNPIPPNYGDFPPRHPKRLQEWKDWVVNRLGFPADKIKNVGYMKGPNHWPNVIDPKKPMVGYVPPFGLFYWQYHPAHVVEVLPDGTQVRKPTIRVWYEKWLVFEGSWCPAGTVVTRDENGSESCPMPAAPAKSSAAASGGAGSASASASAPASASASAGSPGGQSSGLASTSSSLIGSSSSSKSKAVVWVTATAEVTVTDDVDVTKTVMPGTAVPSGSLASTADIWRIASITQDIAFTDGNSNHTATVSIIQVDGDKKTNVVTARASDGGGPVKLPSELVVTDNSGGALTIYFKEGDKPFDLKSQIGGVDQQWSSNLFSNKTPGGPWCEIKKNTPGEGVLKRSLDCHYRAWGQ
ncbi:hypothetical protein CORC01_11143 [Colletotrichum orchidophilum]|uniref:Uncharacterized protein n=1 Tax=Colletotrichum orchidophilum TaxID=1209926 RepID=A0A1G4AWQ5_9PEZI|nr:uncharacterized protein CORC01_11143 [Colletotrichum orchidophilum]OHE93546.1 hypothetical protein CORC01_11143 [Colletotrichum orchidophilum]